MFKSAIHKFTMDLIAIDYDTGESTDLNNSILSVAIKKNYLENVFPLYSISLKVKKEIREKLIKNNFYLSLKIYRNSQENVEDINSSYDYIDDPDTDKIVSNILLRPFNKPRMIDWNKQSDIDENEYTNDTKKEQLFNYSLNCIPLEELKVNNKILNYCYANANLNEIIINLISEEYNKDIYYQESQNINRYDTLLIPPMSLISSLRYLQDNYTIYNHSLNLFFDDLKLYIYDIKDKNRYFTNRLNIIIEQNLSNLSQTKYVENLIDDENNINKTIDHYPLFINNTEINNYIHGDNILYNSYDNNFNLVSRNYTLSNNLDKSDRKQRVHWNPDIKKYFEERNLSLFNIITQISLSNIDPTLISPETKISITGSELPELVGEFALTEMDIFYTSKDFKNFSNTIILNLVNKQ